MAFETVLVIFPDTPIGLRPILAFAGALAVAVLIQAIVMRRTGGATLRFILTGIGVAAFLGAVTQAMLTYGDLDRAMAALSWLAGSVHAVGWTDVFVLSICLILLIPALIWSARPLSALRMGAEIAAGLGADFARDRAALIALSVA